MTIRAEDAGHEFQQSIEKGGPSDIQNLADTIIDQMEESERRRLEPIEVDKEIINRAQKLKDKCVVSLKEHAKRNGLENDTANQEMIVTRYADLDRAVRAVKYDAKTVGEILAEQVEETSDLNGYTPEDIGDLFQELVDERMEDGLTKNPSLFIESKAKPIAKETILKKLNDENKEAYEQSTDAIDSFFQHLKSLEKGKNQDMSMG